MLEKLDERCRQSIMTYRTLKKTSFILTLLIGLPSGPFPAFAQDAAWDGFINAGRTALQQDKFGEAERHFEEALETAEKFPPGDPRLGRSLNNLAAVYYKQQDYDRAEPLMRRSLNVLEESLGPSNADVAQTKKNLAAIYYLQGNFADAEPLLKESLSTLEELHGPNHAFVATVLNNLAALYQTQNRYTDAEPLLARSLKIWETLLGPDHQDVTKSRELLVRLREANQQDPDQSGEQQVAETTPEITTEIPQTTANQIIALAAEAEAAVDEANDSNVPGLVPGPEVGRDNNQTEEATNALAALTTDARAAATNNSDNIGAADSSEENLGRQGTLLPTPEIQTAGLPAIEDGAASGDPNFAIYLSTLWSEDEAKRYWTALKQEIPDLLAGKEMELEEVVLANGGGSFYRVLTSPFTSDPAAQETCDEIRSQVRTHDCSVIAR